MKKRFLAILLALVMVLAMLPTAAFAADSDFTISKDGVLLSYNGPGGDVVIPEGVTAIMTNAFAGYTDITSITIPSSLGGLLPGSFSSFTSLTSIQVNKGSPFYAAVDGVLFNAAKDTLIRYPAGKQGASYTIPNSVTTIDYSAFQNSTGLTSVTIPDSVTTIKSSAFYACTALTNVTIPNSVTSIGDRAFWKCTGLTSMTIPNSVTSIGERAFFGCTALTNVTIGSGVTSIGGRAFQDTPWLKTQEEFAVANGILFLYQGQGGAVTIPDGITCIGDCAFYDCKSMISVTIPNSVTSIGMDAFQYCGLASVTIPGSVTSIGVRAFEHCKGLTSVTIGSGVTSIEKDAFKSCTRLTSVTIPGSVTSIGRYAFQYCTALKDVYYGGTEAQWEAIGYSDASLTSAAIHYNSTGPDQTQQPNSEFTIENGELTRYSGPGGAVTIPNSVTSIGFKAFHDCTGLTSVTIPGSVTSIGTHAFEGCISLTSVTIGSGVTSIGVGAFMGCTSLTSVIIPDSVTSIDFVAFEGCTSLTSVTIPNSVTTIWSSTFPGCTSLKDVYFPGTEDQWKAIVKYDTTLTSATIHYNSTAPAKPATTFTDVPENIYYAKPVVWAVENKITKGTSSTAFSPDKTCTHAEILTFLWRAAGSPAPAEAVNSSEYYANALQWAKEQGITSGTVSPDAPCLRGSVVDYMWKYAGAPTYSDTTIPFTDVDANSAMAVKWAFDNGVTKGSSSTTFSPDGTCTRGEIVTFLYRAFAE